MEQLKFTMQTFDDGYPQMFNNDYQEKLQQTPPKATGPTFYREYQVVHEQLDFNNRIVQDRENLFEDEKPIILKNTLRGDAINMSRTMGSTGKSTKRKSLSQGKKKKKMGGTNRINNVKSSGYGMVKVPKSRQQDFQARVKMSKTRKAYSPLQSSRSGVKKGGNTLRNQENIPSKANTTVASRTDGGWNTDTRTDGFFDNKIRKKTIFSLNDKENWAEDKKKKIDEVKKMKKEADFKQKFFTDFDDLQQFAEEKSPEKNLAFVPTATSNKIKPKPESPDQKLQKYLKEKEEEEGELNPAFKLKLKKELESGQKKKFFVGMNPQREKIFKNSNAASKKRKVPQKYQNVKSQFLNYPKRGRSNSNTRKKSALSQNKYDHRDHTGDRTLSLDRTFNNSAEKMAHIYGHDHFNLTNRGHSAENYHRNRSQNLQKSMSPKRVDFNIDQVPSRENGHRSIKDVIAHQRKSLSGKKSNSKLRKYQQQQAIDTDRMLQKTINENLQIHYNREIQRQVELDKVAHQYQNQLEKRINEPNQYFNQVQIGLQQIKSNMAPLMEELHRTGKYLQRESSYNKIVSRGAGKIVLVYADKLSEAMIDDLILEMIPFLQMKESHINRERQQKYKTKVFGDCIDALRTLTIDQNKIKEKVEEMQVLNALQNKTIKEIDTIQASVPKPVKFNRQSKLTLGQINSIYKHREEYKSFKREDEVLNDDMMFKMDFATKEIMRELMDDLTAEFWSLQDRYVEKVFEGEFQ